ncbi:hypothetical protein N0B31_15965 [Salinirubellus salinus]|uniref:DUF445 family protein n=1 Tax=Salinirubellus salinus TaxID=1364945 RepID=A0A9E7U7I8_9EURY|nr:hypothetical protein [Salinirubellus salinus]UWM53626.1 hypothetical protein N0B31_15965 [Salinirubellus salinus]
MIPSNIDWSLLLIPPITGVIGYITNWVGIRLLFKPLNFVGVRVRGLEEFVPHLPEKLQQIPGVMEGRLGWQGIIPSRAAKMGSIAVDKGVGKLATQEEYYDRFDSEEIASHIVATAGDEIRDLVEEVIRREHPQLWADMPDAGKELVFTRVERQLPEVTERITEEMGHHVDELLDVKLMIMNHLEEHPELINRMFLETGERELKFIVNSGFYLGTLLGMVSIPLFVFVQSPFVLPVAGIFVGYFTNYIAIKAIFQPQNPIQVGPFTIQGLFLKRQNEASETYASIVAEDIITVQNVARNMLYGRKSDRTRRLIREALRPAVDDAVGVAGPLVRVTTGEREYEAIRESVATESVEAALEPLSDPEFNRQRAAAVQSLVAERMKALSRPEFAETLRTAFKEDEWMLIWVGAVLGFVAGWIQLAVVTAV